MQEIMQEINRFDADIPNGVENYMGLQLIKIWFLLTACNLWILDQMQWSKICQIMILSIDPLNLVIDN